MIHLASVVLRQPKERGENFPFNIPALQGVREVTFSVPVTFLVGENGSGKSTFLEALAYAARLTTVGSEHVTRDETLTAVWQLGKQMRLSWRRKTHKGFFLRAEDFFGYVKRLAQMEADLKREMAEMDEETEGRSVLAQGLARMPFARELEAMRAQYGRNLATFSHGESFLELFQSRLKPNGFYLLDEPEAPLSPLRQLTLLSMIKHMVAAGCQFVIATHSPILMAFPGAEILSFDERPLQAVPYESLEHVVVTRSFLENPEQYLRHL
ncbi:MAG: ATP-binding cassette domain-containing protein [Chloroflexi bacterium]|nr:MAG: ATP-binding cassette domain-containing protein [Chloroflexota bacterium]